MKEQLISFETAKLAKEKGFNLFVNAWYNLNEVVIQHGKYENVSFKDWNNFSDPIGRKKGTDGKNSYSAPTQSLLQRWLREMHKINIDIYSDTNKHRYYLSVINAYQNNDFNCTIKDNDGFIKMFQTYEEALEKGLQEALKLL